jgi:hypothetical protein
MKSGKAKTRYDRLVKSAALKPGDKGAGEESIRTWWAWKTSILLGAKDPCGKTQIWLKFPRI